MGELKNATEATGQVLSLPIEPMYEEEICRKVVEGVKVWSYEKGFVRGEKKN